jgi:hypothetical protein
MQHYYDGYVTLLLVQTFLSIYYYSTSNYSASQQSLVRTLTSNCK